MSIYDLAALGAALCFALSPLLAVAPVAAIGPFAFNLTRQSIVAAILAAVVVITGGWQGITAAQITALALSGLVGIFLGDTFLFFGMERLGPRRNGALFALNAPFAALLGWAFLGEALPAMAVGGIALAAAGVALAVLGRPGRSGQHRFEAVRGPLWQGIGFGLLGASGQALGTLIARPAMAGGVDPFTASLIRSTVSVAALAVLMGAAPRRFHAKGPVDGRVLRQVLLSGLVAMVAGMTLLMFALQGGKVGIVSTLSASSPVLILPILWIATRARPSATSWAGAALTVAGLALIFLR